MGTDAEEEEVDEEDVEDGQDGHGERGHDAAERLDAAEKADDAEGADDADDARGLVGFDDADDGEDDDERVQPGPGVAHEGREPVAEGVHAELDGEDDGEEDVPAVELDGHVGLEAVLVREERAELRLDDGAREVLRARTGGESVCRGAG